MMKRRGKFIAAAVSTAVALAAAAVTLYFVLRPESYRVIKIFDLNGSGSVSRKSLGDIEPYKGMNLESGDKVATHSESTMRITLDDTKYVFMEPQTTMELVASGDEDENMTRIILGEGAVLNELTRPLLASAYEVVAPKAAFSVIGTSFRISVDKDEYGDYITILHVFHGTVRTVLLGDDDKPTDREITVGEDKTVVIKTVRRENSSNDPAVDGRSFFVFPDEDGVLTETSPNADPMFDIDYSVFTYDTLKEIYDTDASGKIVLSSPVRKKIIEAMIRLRDPTNTGGTIVSDSSQEQDESSSSESSMPDSTEPDSSSDASSSSSESESSSAKDKDSLGSSESSSSKKDSSRTDKPKSDSSSKKPSSSSRAAVSSSPSSSSVPDTSSSEADTSHQSDNSVPDDPSSAAPLPSSAADSSRDPKKDSSSATSSQEYVRPPSTSSGGGTGRPSESSVPDYSIPDSKPDESEPEVYYNVYFLDRNGNTIMTATVPKGGSVEPPRRGYEESYTTENGSIMIFEGWDTDCSDVQSDLWVRPIYEPIPAPPSDSG